MRIQKPGEKKHGLSSIHFILIDLYNGFIWPSNGVCLKICCFPLTSRKLRLGMSWLRAVGNVLGFTPCCCWAPW